MPENNDITHDMTLYDEAGNPVSVIFDGVNYRLAVDAAVTPSVIPASKVVYQTLTLETAGGNRSMDVNGAGTPVEFRRIVPAGQTWYLCKIILFIFDPGTADFNDFGSIGGGLSNGLLTEVNINAVDYEISTVLTNQELMREFPEEAVVAGSNAGWINSQDYYKGAIKFPTPITLETGDVIKATVQDNLNPLSELAMGIEYMRVI